MAAALSSCRAALDGLVVARGVGEADEGKRAEYVAAYEVGLVSLKKALSDLLAPRDPALCDPSEWRGLVVLAVVVLPAHCGRHTWTSDKSRTAAKGLVSQLVLRSGCHSVQELLVGQEEGGTPNSPMTPPTPPHDGGVGSGCRVEGGEGWGENTHRTDTHGQETGSRGGFAVVGVLREVLPLLCGSLTRQEWKEHPTQKHSLIWCLRHLTHPHLGGPRLHLFLPPLLLFVDDYEPYNKTLALRALAHLLRNVNPTELRWQGRDMVIFEAVRSMLYSSEVDIVQALHPCLLRLLPVLEGPPPIKHDTPKARTVTDQVFDTYLNTLNTESKQAQRKALTDHLCGYIELLGAGVVRHLPRLLRTLYHCVEWPDLAGEGTLQNCLRALQEVIREAWPRISHHRDDIFRCLLRLIASCCHGDLGTLPNTNTPELDVLHSTVDCLVLVQRACGGLEPFMDALSRDTVHEGLHYTIEQWRAKIESN